MNISCCLHIPLFSELLGIVLDFYEDFSNLPFDPACSGNASNSPNRLDIVIIDRHIASLNADLFKGNPDIKFILLCTNEEMKGALMSLRQYFGKNLRGLLSYDCGMPMLEKAIRHVHSGELWLPRALWEDVLSVRNNPGRLTRKEKAISSYICGGFTNKEIALKMELSEQTVKSHCNKIFKKLGISNRVQLAMHYRDLRENHL